MVSLHRGLAVCMIGAEANGPMGHQVGVMPTVCSSTLGQSLRALISHHTEPGGRSPVGSQLGLVSNMVTNSPA
jgi:hypothetical protein